MAQQNSMDVDPPNDPNSNTNNNDNVNLPTNNNKNKNDNKSKNDEYELSVQLVMHNSPARCVVAIDNDTIISGGRKQGEFILWKRMTQQPINNTNNDDQDQKMVDKTNKPLTSTINFDGSIVFDSDKFHPLTFCAVRHRLKSDPQRIVSGGSDQRAVLWDIDGNIIQILSGHTNSVNSVDVTNNGQVITGSFDSTAKIWDVNGKCLHTLSGHQHGVEVCSLESGELVTGTFKLFNIWSADGKLIKTEKFAHDHMIRKVRRHPLGFLTAGNDGYVNLWSNKGESLRKILAHPVNADIPSFVYGLHCMPSGDWISCGEDGTVKIFNVDGYLQQQLRHPGAVWDVSMLPNGDIISACADGAIRVWSKDPLRKADNDVVSEYYKMLQMTKQAQSGGQVSPDKLESIDVLNSPGKPGEFKMINDPKKGPSVYQYDSSSMEWKYVGEIMGKPGGANDKRPQINGVHYDYVTQIDVNGSDKVPLGFNKDDDPHQIAVDFCTINSIDLDLHKKIEAHLKPMVDPVARAARLERERIARSKQLRHIPSFKQCGYEIHSKLKLDGMKKKIFEFNNDILKNDEFKDNYRSFGITDLTEFDALFEILSDQTVWHVAEFPLYCIDLIGNKLLKWPTSRVLPILDMIRILMLHQDAVDKLITNNENIRNLIIEHISDDDNCTGNIRMIVSRLLSNYLAKRKRSKSERLQNKYPEYIFDFLQQSLSLMSSAAINQKSSINISYIMLAHNTMIWFAKFQIDECDLYLIIISALFELLNELKLNNKILYYCMSLIGTCAWCSNTAKQQIIDLFDNQLKDIINKARHSKDEACQQIGNDLWNIFGLN